MTDVIEPPVAGALRKPLTSGADRQPRIMIAVGNGFSIRYLLQTEILKRLRAFEAEIVIVAQGRGEVLARFAGKGVVVDSVPNEIGNSFASSGRIQRALQFIRHYTFGDWVQTLEDHYGIARDEARLEDAPVRTRINMLLLRAVIRIARKSRTVRRAILRLESALYCPEAYATPITRYRPDLLVTSSLGTFDYDYYLMRAARRLGVPSAAVILSWDNTTTRGYPGADADYVITWTEAMREEAIKYCDVPDKWITVGGVAHFDDYFRPDPDFDRAAFMIRLGLDPAKRTIFFATKSPNGYAYNPNIAQMLGEAVADGRLPDDVQVLVRVHPLHYRYRDGKMIYQGAIEAFRRISQKFPAIIINEPEIQSARVSSDMADSEIRLLSRLIRSSDVIVNVFSTLNLEGAIFDRPLVNVCFEDDEQLYDCEMTPRFDIDIDLRATHNQRLLGTGGVRMVHSPAEMIEAVGEYLEDPARERAGRQRIVAQEIGPNHGHAGEYIADTLYKWARKRVHSGTVTIDN